ncbi:universal stress protein [Patulibacter sp. SYSU D01012]|uniref:universal stress protein n=1 Tax=Patulibacter sp. SYSU D01012 TaxID=2817381 RepID=UPI001B30CDB1|nr:universal stress protein [Patulibacter sp. SYSU D01012]
MFTRVLVGFDGTPASVSALRLAHRLAGPGADLIVASVVPATRRGLGVAAPADATAHLDHARALLGHRGHVEYVAPAASSVSRGLHRIAAETMCDLIVVGSSRRRGAGHVLLGSNSEATLHGAPCAVAVAPDEPPARLDRLGVMFDGTPAGERVVRGAAELAQGHDAALTVLAVVDTRHDRAAFADAGLSGDARAGARAALAAATADLPAVRRVHRQLHQGDPVHEALSLGRDVDLLVLGSRGQGAVLRLLLGSVSTKVVRRARCAVLVMPEGARVPVAAPGLRPEPAAA